MKTIDYITIGVGIITLILWMINEHKKDKAEFEYFKTLPKKEKEMFYMLRR